jgi:hypothetical protein
MVEAVVRTCSAVNGVASAAIPDECLSQTAPIIAWVYAVGETSGTTIKTITLPIIQRARPQQTPAPIPPEVYNQYTELIGEVNEHIGSLKDGSVHVGYAYWAGKVPRLVKTEADNGIVGTFEMEAVMHDSIGSEYYALVPSANGCQNIGTEAKKLYRVFASEFKGVADEAVAAPNMGTYDDSAIASELKSNLGQAFTFPNTNGFGTQGAKGYFKVWSRRGADGEYYCCLEPSISGNQNLGSYNHIYGKVFSDQIRTNGLCTTDGRKIMETGAFAEDGYVECAFDNVILPQAGVYMFLVNGGDQKPATVIMDVRDGHRSSEFSTIIVRDDKSTERTSVFLFATKQGDGQIKVVATRDTDGELTPPDDGYIKYRPICLY